MRSKGKVIGLICSALALSSLGCVVPQTRYEEALSALRVEGEAHRRTQARLYEVESKLAALQAELTDRESRLEHDAQQIADREYQVSVIDKQREDATALVDQLRGELTRAGDHLGIFVEERSRLSDALDAAEARADRLAESERQATHSAAIMRDLALIFAEPVTLGEVELEVEGGQPTVRLPSDRLLTADGLHPEAQKSLTKLAKALGLYPGTRLTISETSSPAATQEQAAVRLKRIADVLTAQGLEPARIAIDVPADAKKAQPDQKGAAPATQRDAPEIRFTFAPADR